LLTEHGCLQSAETVRDWTAALNTAIRQGSYRPRKLLVFLNPYGGAKRARQVWQTVVAPIFDLAGACHASLDESSFRMVQTSGDAGWAASHRLPLCLLV